MALAISALIILGYKKEKHASLIPVILDQFCYVMELVKPVQIFKK